MEEKDLKQIEQLFLKGFAQIWEHNLEPVLNKIQDDMNALNSKVTNYLELSDKRYLELKRKNLILAKWVKQLADKTGLKLDLKELEEF